MSQSRSPVSDETEHQIASEHVERRRLSRLMDALPVLAGFISPDGHLLHTAGPSHQTFIWDMPEFAYSHDAVTAIIDLSDRAARGERIQIERPYRISSDKNRDIKLGRGLLTLDPMRDEDGNVSEIAVSLIDCDDHEITPSKPMEKSRLAIANHRIESTLSFAQMVIETLWDQSTDVDGAKSNNAGPSGSENSAQSDIKDAADTARRDRMSDRLDMIASIINPISDPDLNVVPLEIIIDSVVAAQPDIPSDTRLKVLLPDADIPMDFVPLVALMIGELLSNAYKHGAWNDNNTRRRGQVCIEADKFDGPAGSYLRIDWTEDGGPNVTEFETQGFGLTLCERLFPQMTGGTATMTNLEDGISWTFEFPIPELDVEVSSSRSRAPQLVYSNLSEFDLPPEHDLDPA